MDEDTQMHSSKCLIPVNQTPHLTKDRFPWIILIYAILSALDVNNITDYNIGKVKKSLSKIISSDSLGIKSQGR